MLRIFRRPHSNHSPRRTTTFIMHGTAAVTCLLTAILLIYHGVVTSVWLDSATWAVAAVIVYLLIAEFFLKKQRLIIVSWMLIIFYLILAAATLMAWGISTAMGLLAISFAVVLPSVLIGTRFIFPVTVLAISCLITIQSFHSFHILSPDTQILALPPTYWDVATYSAALSVFALVSWLSVGQREKSLKRALAAEAALTMQKDALKMELEKESATLRLTELGRIHQLHQFALIGQSTAATLHELSNHLGVLNLDIDDIKQHHSNSKAISNAKNSIEHINTMVRQARFQLGSYDYHKPFNAISVINRSVKDLSEKFASKQVELIKTPIKGRGAFTVNGSSLALMQIITIVLNNALDACYNSPHPQVRVDVHTSLKTLTVTITDTGPGISTEAQTTLFSPKMSTKTSGLGVGLYIAQHLAIDQLNGSLTLATSRVGARFVITLPRK